MPSIEFKLDALTNKCSGISSMQDGHVQQKALVIFLVGLVFLIFKKYPSVVKCEVVFNMDKLSYKV